MNPRTTRRALPLAALTALAPVAALLPAAPAAAATPWSQAWQVGTPAGLYLTSPVLADLPQGKLVLAADMTGRLRAVRSDGSVAWNSAVDPRAGSPAAVVSSPAVGDLDNDGRNDIVIGAGAVTPRERKDAGGVVAFNADGSVKWRFQSKDTFNVYNDALGPDGLSDGVTTTPAIGDVDGNGVNDVVFGSLDHFIYALDGRTGAVLPGFPYDNGDTIFSSPALYDLDGDGRLEILIGGDATPNPPANWYAKGTFRALDSTGTGLRQYWMRTFEDIVSGSPVIGDVNGDGRPEAVFTTGGYLYDSIDSRRVWAVHLDDGSNVPGWPVTTDAKLFTSPALGDVVPGDGGRPEVVLGDRDGYVYAFRGNGQRAWKTDPGSAARGRSGSGYEGGASIADLDGDGDQDIAIGYGNGGALVLHGHTGALMRNVYGSGSIGYAVVGAPAVVDWGGTTGRQLVLAGWNPGDNISRPDLSRGVLTGISLAPTSAPAASPLFRKNARRLGADPTGGNPLPPGFCRPNSNPPNVGSAASGRGYWVLARQGGLFTFDTPFFGAPSGTRLPIPSEAMAARPQGDGYWVVGPGGAVQDFGGARWYGDPRGLPLSGPVVDIAPTPTGNGYWLVTSDGAVFSYGDAQFHGSHGTLRIPPLTSPVVSITPTLSGRGYWLAIGDGGVFTFGDAPFHGSPGALRIPDPVTSLAASPTGGYWVLARDGGVFSFGTPYYGSIAGIGMCAVGDPAVKLLPTATGKGYWVVGSKGGVFTFGDAAFHGSPVPYLGRDTVVDMALAR